MKHKPPYPSYPNSQQGEGSSPWRGLASFDENSQRFFFGRDLEIDNLYFRVREHPLTVLYSRSGLGKTSLLGAGLIPRLRINNYRPSIVRLRYDSSDAPLIDQIREAMVKLLYGSNDVSNTLGHDTLWEILHHCALRPKNLEDRPPVIILDQFEEVFSLAPKTNRVDQVGDLIRQIADIIQNRPPKALQGRFELHPDLESEYDMAPSSMRFIIALREEYLSNLEEWKVTLPALMRNRQNIHELCGQQALEAVVWPGQLDDRNLIDNNVGQIIVRTVAQCDSEFPFDDIRVAPPLLSLMCDELNKTRLNLNEDAISVQLVESKSGDIIHSFLDKTFSEHPDAVRTLIEDRLITEDGHRSQIDMNDAEIFLGQAKVNEPKSSLREIIASRVISVEERSGVCWLEITHDILAMPLVDSRNERRQRELENETQEQRERINKTESFFNFLVNSISGRVDPLIRDDLFDQIEIYYSGVRREDRDSPGTKKNRADLAYKIGLARMQKDSGSGAEESFRFAKKLWEELFDQTNVERADRKISEAQDVEKRQDPEDQKPTLTKKNDQYTYDVFISFVLKDDKNNRISLFVEEIKQVFLEKSGRPLRVFFDKYELDPNHVWSHGAHLAVTQSFSFLACLSPSFLSSRWCQREVEAFQGAGDSSGTGLIPILLGECPDLQNSPGSQTGNNWISSLARRQFLDLKYFFEEGAMALKDPDVKKRIDLVCDQILEASNRSSHIVQSPTTLPPHNKFFLGRVEQLRQLHETLHLGRQGVVACINGHGGTGKTELIFCFAHVYASDYPGGRFLLRCAGLSGYDQAIMELRDVFGDRIDDHEQMSSDLFVEEIELCLHQQLKKLGDVLLVLDNVTEPSLLEGQQFNLFKLFGPRLHLAVTTRLPSNQAAHFAWLTLGALPVDDAVQLLENYRPLKNSSERNASLEIVRNLQGFPAALKQVAAILQNTPDISYVRLANELKMMNTNFDSNHHSEKYPVGAILEIALQDLSSIEIRILEFASLLAPENIPILWLMALAGGDSQNPSPPNLRPDQWEHLWRKLVAKGLLFLVPDHHTGGMENSFSNLSVNTIFQIHGLIQEQILSRMSIPDINNRIKTLERYTMKRNDVLRMATDPHQYMWEIAPLEALAKHWDKTNHEKAKWLLNQVGLRWCNVNQWARAETIFKKMLEHDEMTFGPDSPQIVDSLNSLSELFLTTNRLSESEYLIRRALAINSQVFGEHHQNVARDLNRLAKILKTTNRLSKAESLMRQVIEIDEENYGFDHPVIAEDLNSLAQLLQTSKRLDEAEPLFRRALEIMEESIGPVHPDIAKTLHSLAQILRSRNCHFEAESKMLRALAIDEEVYGPDHSNVATGLFNLAELLQATGRMSESEPLIRRVLEINEKTNRSDQPLKIASSLNNLAQLLWATNRFSESEPLMRQALEIYERFYGPNHPIVANSLNSLAQLLQSTNRYDESEPLMRQALEIEINSFGPDHPNVAIQLSNLSQLLMAMGNFASAEPLLRRSLEINENVFGPDHPQVVPFSTKLVQLLQTIGEVNEAEVLSQRILIIVRSNGEFGSDNPLSHEVVKNHLNLLELMGYSTDDAIHKTMEIISEK